MAHINPSDAPVYNYPSSSQRWTWQNRQKDGATVLSEKRFGLDGDCCYHATLAVLEANMRAQRMVTPKLSFEHIKRLEESNRVELKAKGYGRMGRVLRALCDPGIVSADVYEEHLTEDDLKVLPNYGIFSYSQCHVSRPGDIRRALKNHLRKGPMVAVFKISDNYHDCIADGDQIYRYDKERRVLDQNKKVKTHAAPVVGFGIYGGVSYLIFHVFYKGDFVEFSMVDICLVIELYGINV